MYKVLDLFSGAGGMAEGFLQAGFAIPYASDKSEQAATTYINRHIQLGREVKYFCGDISKLARKSELKLFLGEDFNQIDVVCGGPPCQGFSLAGKRNPHDLRNQLVQSYVNILSQIKPKYFVMENVLGILSAKFITYNGIKKTYVNTNAVDVLRNEFSEIGYPDVQIKVLNANDYGVPQKRLRVIFLGTRCDVKTKLYHPLPSIGKKITAKYALSDLASVAEGKTTTAYPGKATTSYQKAARAGRTPAKDGSTLVAAVLSNHKTSLHSDRVKKRFMKLREGESIGAMLERLKPELKLALATKKQSCRKIDSSEPSPTVLTLPDDLVHYSENRILSVREMARLQSFDDSFEFLGKRTTGGDRRKLETPQYTLVGNAVPPLLANAIASEIIKNLRAEK